MARATKKLSALSVKNEIRPGYHSDGDGLYLQVSANGAKSWIFRFRYQGKGREMGIGGVSAVTLAEARDKAQHYRKLLSEGIDPIADRQAQRDAYKVNLSHTFSTVSGQYFASKSIEFKNEKHAAQWITSLRTYAFPIIGDKPVSAVALADVCDVLRPIWTVKNETASRLRGRIEAVLGYAKTLGLRSGDNPAVWGDNLDKVFAAPAKVQSSSSRNMPALPYSEVAAFLRDLRQQTGIAAVALQFAILTAARSGEIFGATWREFDLDNKLWTIPAGRMKAGREHRVPLSDSAMRILNDMLALRTSDADFVFHNRRERGETKMLSNMAMTAVCRRMGVPVVPHGFRSTFRDWVEECTDTPHTVAEMALAHTIGNKVEAAYRRGDLLLKRQILMQAWADYCEKAPAAVVAIARATEGQAAGAAA